MSKILVVDDETDLEILIKQKFRKEIRNKEYEFFFAINGKDALEKLLEEQGDEIPYKINSFKYENQYKFFLHQVESRMDDAIEEVQEEIAAKMKFGFEFTGQLHNDD